MIIQHLPETVVQNIRKNVLQADEEDGSGGSSDELDRYTSTYASTPESELSPATSGLRSAGGSGLKSIHSGDSTGKGVRLFPLRIRPFAFLGPLHPTPHPTCTRALAHTVVHSKLEKLKSDTLKGSPTSWVPRNSSQGYTI